VFHTILVALDDSTPSQAVSDTLAQLRLTPEHLVILSHVMVLPGEDADATQPRATMDMDPERAKQSLIAYQDSLPCPSKIEIVQGEPAAEILRLAQIYQADLIILGSRGLTGFKRILQGSVSSQVVEEAPCAVLVLKAGEPL
jgi:nucleotide-binding universal stress UspA family protein